MVTAGKLEPCEFLGVGWSRVGFRLCHRRMKNLVSFLLLVHGKNFEPVYSWAAVSHRGMFSVFTVPCFNSVNNRMLDESHSVTA